MRTFTLGLLLCAAALAAWLHSVDALVPLLVEAGVL